MPSPRAPAESGRSAADAGLSRSLAAGLFVPVDGASLACFRAAFGAIMAWEVARYFGHGWIAANYIRPTFHFTYYGFGWMSPWPGDGMYVHFAALGILAVCIMLGLFYRWAAALFFLGFAHVFLIDQAYYLNHFYLIVLLSLLLAVIPAHRVLSLDAARRPEPRASAVPVWALWLLRAQVAIPYFYGGLAKLNADWLRGEPIRAWLAERTEIPLIGPLLTHEWAPLLFAYGGLLFDLLVVPLLLWRPSRAYAFGAALVFHGLNAILFQIGVFPWLMLAATTLFLPPDWPRHLGLKLGDPPPQASAQARPQGPSQLVTFVALGTYLAVQALVPLRHLVYPGDVNWTEEGHRFSWHMKLRDKEAEGVFFVKDAPERPWRPVQPREHLSPRQAAKMLATPDMILQYAHHLAALARREGYEAVLVRARVSASLNSRRPQLLVDPSVDLAGQPRTLEAAGWILPLREPPP